MSIVNTRDKTINTKIVYYGPGLGGKTTSLQFVHSVLDVDQTTKMVSLKTDEERTLFFDFLPIDLGMVGGYKVKIQGFTVPGQVKYNLTRKYVLMGADAVVFVADSQKSRLNENIESLKNLFANLKANGLDPEQVPLIIQYNKRDLGNLSSIEELDAVLKKREEPCFPTTAADGNGVFEAFIEASCRMIRAVGLKYQLTAEGSDIGKQAEDALMRYMPTSR